MQTYGYFTTRNEAKTIFCAAITVPVEDMDEFFIERDLSNVVALVEINTETNERKVHAFNADEAALIDFDASADYLWQDAIRMSEEYDEGASGDFEFQMQNRTPILGGMDITFYMDLDLLN